MCKWTSHPCQRKNQQDEYAFEKDPARVKSQQAERAKEDAVKESAAEEEREKNEDLNATKKEGRP